MQEPRHSMALTAAGSPRILERALSPNQNAALVAIHFLAIYLELSVYLGQSLIFPYAGSTLLALFGGFMNRSAIRFDHLSVIGMFILAVGLVTVVPTLSGTVQPIEFLKSFVQLVAAILSAYCMFIVFILSSRERLVQWFSVILAVLIVGSFLERFQPVRDVSDAFRKILYPEKMLYSADYRDIVSYGAVRPRFFAREPSIVGIGAGLLISMIFLLIKSQFVVRVAGALLLSLICVVIMRSPTIIFFSAVVFYGGLALRPGDQGKYSWFVAAGMVASLIGLSFLLVYGTGLAGLSSRTILGGGSYVIRMFGPPLIWLETLRDHMMFGLGLGSFEALLPIGRKAYGSYGILALFPDIRTQRDGAVLISNGFWEYWIFFGLAGGTLLIMLLIRLFRTFGIERLAFPFVAWLLAMQTFGGVSAYRPWHMLFVFAAIAFIVQRVDVPRTAVRAV